MLEQGWRFTFSQAAAGLLIAALAVVCNSVTAQSETAAPAAEKKARLVDLWRPGDPGQRMNIRGRVTSLDGTPLPGIHISIRQANGEGDYTEQYRTTLVTDDKGRYQFGSVVPGNYLSARHVHVTVYQDGWEFFDMSILFKGDPNLESHYEHGKPIFLEESTVNGETIMFGRFDIVLTPD